MLGGDIGRVRRERWAEGLEAGKKTRPEHCREPSRGRSTTVARQARVQALLDAFFKEDGEGGPSRGRERLDCDQGPGARRLPSLEDDLRREQERLLPLRERRRAALTLERSAALFVVVRVDPRGLRADEGRARRARFQRSDRARAGAGDAVERRLGVAQARLWARSPAARRSAGRVSRRNGAFSPR